MTVEELADMYNKYILSLDNSVERIATKVAKKVTFAEGEFITKLVKACDYDKKLIRIMLQDVKEDIEECLKAVEEEQK